MVRKRDGETMRRRDGGTPRRVRSFPSPSLAFTRSLILSISRSPHLVVSPPPPLSPSSFLGDLGVLAVNLLRVSVAPW